jgi:hypothetical protein
MKYVLEEAVLWIQTISSDSDPQFISQIRLWIGIRILRLTFYPNFFSLNSAFPCLHLEPVRQNKRFRKEEKKLFLFSVRSAIFHKNYYIKTVPGSEFVSEYELFFRIRIRAKLFRFGTTTLDLVLQK